MKLLTSTKDLAKEFARMIKSYDHYTWAVAWAGDVKDFDMADILRKNESKVDKIVIGLHFYQTAPNFIAKFIKCKGFRFYTNSDGIFHSKVYLFWNDKDNWQAIIGSSNFTKAGFGMNTETNVLIDNNDGGRITFNQIMKVVNGIWDNASIFNEKELNAYTNNWKLHRPQIRSLAKMPKQRGSGHIIEDSLISWDWDTYVKRIKHEPKGWFENRIAVLKESQLLFSEHKSFLDFSDIEKSKVGGWYERKAASDLDWKSFGSNAYGKFKRYLLDNTAVAKAIDKIPLYGSVHKEDVNRYFKIFEKHFNANLLASATRLLAMKRPDTFICINKRNKKELCLSLGLSQSSITLNNYWDLVIAPIKDSVWFNVNNIRPDEKDIKNFQVALLDAAFYIG